jgi:hypothetical protein
LDQKTRQTEGGETCGYRMLDGLRPLTGWVSDALPEKARDDPT